jgi:molybdopterin-guanine dinucleotide biosynthesis protein A
MGRREEWSVGTEDAWDAVVLAGGRARRLGGVDKAALQIRGRSLLGIALAACAGARYRVVVGPQRLTDEPIRWARESPAGSGPLAALGAGLAVLPGGSAVVVVLAADLPAVDTGLVGRLRAAVAGSTRVDGAIVVDDQHRAQPLLAAYRRTPLEQAITEIGGLRDRPVRSILDRLTVTAIVDTTAADDIDTPADLARWTHNRPGRP